MLCAHGPPVDRAGRGGRLAVATGCDSGEPDAETDSTAPVVQLGGPGETNRVLSEEELAATPSVPGHTAGDVDFVNSMIAHHQQALDMTALVDARAADDGLPLLAERMEVSQIAEIEQLQGWLTARGEDPEGFQQHAGMQMPGMLTAEQLAALAAASGEEFDSLFLQSMIRHHEGAVIMVETLLGEGARRAGAAAVPDRPGHRIRPAGRDRPHEVAARRAGACGEH